MFLSAADKIFEFNMLCSSIMRHYKFVMWEFIFPVVLLDSMSSGHPTLILSNQCSIDPWTLNTAAPVGAPTRMESFNYVIFGLWIWLCWWWKIFLFHHNPWQLLGMDCTLCHCSITSLSCQSMPAQLLAIVQTGCWANFPIHSLVFCVCIWILLKFLISLYGYSAAPKYEFVPRGKV